MFEKKLISEMEKLMKRIFQCWNNFERKEFIMELNIELLKKDTETAEMLCKIVNGFWDRTVELIHNPGDRAIVCRVGDLWFHFLSEEEEQFDAEDIRERYDIFTLSNMILDAIVALKDDNAFMYCNDLLQFTGNQERNRDFYVM